MSFDRPIEPFHNLMLEKRKGNLSEQASVWFCFSGQSQSHCRNASHLADLICNLLANISVVIWNGWLVGWMSELASELELVRSKGAGSKLLCWYH